MTLILAVSTADYIVQVSDRRLTRGSRVNTDEANKAATVSMSNRRYVLGFAGLASVGDFSTSDWLVDQCYEFAKSSLSTPSLKLDRFAETIKEQIQDIYNSEPVRSVARKDDAMYILITGFAESGQPEYAIVANRSAFNCLGTDFRRREFRSFSGTFPSPLLLIGQPTAVAATDTNDLLALAQQNKPQSALIGKAEETIRSAAGRSNAIGKQLSSVVLPREFNQAISTKYHSLQATKVVHSPDQTIVGENNVSAVKGLTLTLDQPVVSPVGKNRLCPCGSGRKYKHCHMRKDASTNWSVHFDPKPRS
jgi:SEC-C motif